MRTAIYIDGFNLYYRLLKYRPQFKWLNPLLLAQEILAREHLITQVNYYTARISVRSNDPEAPARQVAYPKALESVPNVRIHEGNFMVSKVLMALAEPLETRPRDYQWAMPPPNLVQVVKTEEKGSDVNLAAHLVSDAFKDAFDVAVVLSNDTDLVEPIRIVKEEVGKRVGLLVPTRYPSATLAAAASFHLHVRPGHLARAQFPDTVPLTDGTTADEPASWVAPVVS
ncbi:MAG: NYN domain-containing protein [Novosphingobium sp.]|jgi:uncharacterized LabA/DUF88 family protein|uniref:NYN domain-containing protein n=1 Tax=Novosphingobium sp. TaxID=1874826 RepID=UPI0022C4F34C|nr:NYN domain-containing protein [Novosphingobium sp.]MCZ8036264.1 NYN domain-containing protein [Novosphingobium sp.]